MANRTSAIFENTMAGLENGLQVQHIATFSLATCEPDEQVSTVFNRYPTFDQIPVKRENQIIGVLERKVDTKNGVVQDRLRRLDDSLLVAAQEPLARFLPRVKKVGFYCLVLSADKIDGMVTRSDVLKLPVRLLAFTRLVHLESVLTEIIRCEKIDDTELLRTFSPTRQHSIRDQFRNLERQRLEPSLLDLLLFSEKRTIFNTHFSEERFDSDKEIVNLRNQIVHDGNFAPDEQSLFHFIELIEKVDHWIFTLRQKLNPTTDELSFIEPIEE